ncbi:membrane protein insertase YidC, partial [Rhodothermus marinus]|uniref:membrane protein insertase YidC n=1 Tax=Rhodothermus marinus TaxID=29549 RepID=UPI000ADBC79C
ARNGRARTITIETDLYEAQLSTKGATLVSLKLKKYKQYDFKTPVQLVDTTKPGALSLVFTTPTNHLVDTRALYFRTATTADTIRVADAPVEVAFEVPVGDGRIRQIYTFLPDDYEVRLRVEQEGAATFSTIEGYELVWNGGVPFAERDRDDEARHSGAFARSGGELEKITLDRHRTEEKRLAGQVDWVAVKNKFFTA